MAMSPEGFYSSYSSSSSDDPSQSERFVKLLLHLITWKCTFAGRHLLFSGIRRKKKKNAGQVSMAKLLMIADQTLTELSSCAETPGNTDHSSTGVSSSSASTDSVGKRSTGVVARLMGIEFFPDLTSSSSTENSEDFHLQPQRQQQNKLQPLKEFLNPDRKLPSLGELLEENSSEMEEASAIQPRQSRIHQEMIAQPVLVQPFHLEHIFSAESLFQPSEETSCCQIQLGINTKLRALSRLLASPWCLSPSGDSSLVGHHSHSQFRSGNSANAYYRKNALYLEDFLENLTSSSDSGGNLSISYDMHPSDSKTDLEGALGFGRLDQAESEQICQSLSRKARVRHALAIGMLPSVLSPNIQRKEYEKITGIKLQPAHGIGYKVEQGKERNYGRYFPANGYGDSVFINQEKEVQKQFDWEHFDSKATGATSSNLNTFPAEGFKSEKLVETCLSPSAKQPIARCKSMREGGSAAIDFTIPIPLKTNVILDSMVKQQSHHERKGLSMEKKVELNEDKIPLNSAVSNDIQDSSLKDNLKLKGKRDTKRNSSFPKSAGSGLKGSEKALSSLENLKKASRKIPARSPKKGLMFGVSKEVRTWIEEEEKKIADKNPDLAFCAPLSNHKMLSGKAALQGKGKAFSETSVKETTPKKLLNVSSGSNVTNYRSIGSQQMASTPRGRTDQVQTVGGSDYHSRRINRQVIGGGVRGKAVDKAVSTSISPFGSRKDRAYTSLTPGPKAVHSKEHKILGRKNTARSFRAELSPPENHKEHIRKATSFGNSRRPTLKGTFWARRTSIRPVHGYDLIMHDPSFAKDKAQPDLGRLLDPHNSENKTKKTSLLPERDSKLQSQDILARRLQTSDGVSSSLSTEYSSSYHSRASILQQFEQRMEDCSAKFYDVSPADFMDSMNWKQYIFDVLTVAGLTTDNQKQFLSSPSKELEIHPSIFDRLEIHRHLNEAIKVLEYSPPEDAMHALELHYERCQSSRAYYRLLFDCINESLKLGMSGFVFHDTSMILPRLAPSLSGKHLAEEVFMTILEWRKAKIKTIDSFVDADMGNVKENWTDQRQEIAEMIRETESMLLQDVLNEICSVDELKRGRW